MTKGKRVSVAGGGISGLTVAYALSKQGFQVTVLEKENRVGGLLATHQKPLGLVEQAANAFMANSDLEAMSRDIGVPLVAKKNIAKKRYIYRNGKPRRWPLSFMESLKIFRFLLKWLFNKSALKPRPQETLAQWGQRHLGDSGVKNLLAPAMQGVYAVQPDTLSASLLLGGLFRPNPGKKKGVLKGSVAPLGGMGQWIDGLKKYLEAKGVDFKVHDVSSDENFDHPLVVATSLNDAKPWIQGGNKLLSTSLVSVTRQVPEGGAAPPPGFGCLFPKGENFRALGVLYNHCIFEGRSHKSISETWIFDEEFVELEDKALKASVLDDRNRLCGNSPLEGEWSIFRWPQAIPKYDLNLEKWLNSPKASGENIFLMGTYLGDLGLSKLIAKSHAVALQIKEYGKWQNTAS